MLKKVVFKIEGMECASCAINIDGDLEDCGRVKRARTSYAKAQVEVEFDQKEIGEEEIMRIIGKNGYKVARVED